MGETTKTYPCSIRPSHRTFAITFMAIAMVVLCNLSVVPISWSEQHTALTLNTAITLSQPLITNPEALELAINFVSKTMPKLLAGDPILSSHIGFASAEDLRSFQVTGAMLDVPLPIFIIDINDIRSFVRNETQPIEILTKDINWARSPGETFGPTRLLFPIGLNDDAADSKSAPKSSVIIEYTPQTSWRVHHFGGPKLIRAVKTYSTHAHDFMIWIPVVNRHYLGRMGPDLRLKITVLFDDPIAGVKAGHEFDLRDSHVMDKLKALDTKLRNLDRDTRSLKANPNPVTLQGPTGR